MLLIFYMLNLTGALFLQATFLFLGLSSLPPSKGVIIFTKIYPSLKSQKFDLNIEVLNLMFLLTEY